MTADCFAALDLPRRYDLDPDVLQRHYFSAQQRDHPDRLIGLSAPQRQAAIARSMDANEAYETLRSPLRRARHLLALMGFAVTGDAAAIRPSHELLSDMLEQREAMEAITGAEEIQQAFAANETEQKRIQAEMEKAFAKQDWAEAAQLVLRLGYLEKHGAELRARRKSDGP